MRYSSFEMKIYASGKSTLLAVLLLCVAIVVQAQRVCRMDPDVEQDQCSLPYQLGNFQGYYLCDPSVLVGRPETIRDMRDIVTSFEFVQAVGVGHSWWQEQFCSGDDENAVNLVMTELKSTLDFIENPVNPSTFNGQEPPEDFPIKVDEDKQEVTVAAGIPQRALLEYLSEYTYGKEPNGWTLPAFSWFIDQTIGGAVATGTHGSSLQHGSLSSQLTSLRLMLANGTIIDISPEDNPHLFKAAGVSIGRLGVITDITLKIKPQEQVQRTSEDLTFSEFATVIQSVQNDYNDAIEAGDDQAIREALFKVDETQAFWHVQPGVVWKVDFEYANKSAADIPLDTMFIVSEKEESLPVSPVVEFAAEGNITSSPAVAGNVFNQTDNPNKIEPFIPITRNPSTWGSLYLRTLRAYVTPATIDASKAYLTMNERSSETQATSQPYDQYEVAIPLEYAGDCLQGLNQLIYASNDSESIRDGFRPPALIRFVSEEPFYLSPSYGHPVMYINLEDHLSRSLGEENEGFDTVLDFMLEECNSTRLHWGKAGWPTHQPCFDGAEDYPESWCDFGCAVQELDPTGKFRSESDVWRWNATRGGDVVTFSSCCSPEGFLKSECTCEKSPIC
ncbi:hypothetical protein M9434_006624 [Picochlorum sp. BPE23]|nr:hypothetical protein M9434_006624 [Picochlorum sp. BPE23]